MYPDLREYSAKAITDMDFAGFAIGGLSVESLISPMYDILDKTTQHMPKDKARYLMEWVPRTAW